MRASLRGECLLEQLRRGPRRGPGDRQQERAVFDGLDVVWQPVVEHSQGTYVNFESDLTAEVFDRAYPGETGARVLKAWHSYDPDGVLRTFPL